MAGRISPHRILLTTTADAISRWTEKQDGAKRRYGRGINTRAYWLNHRSDKKASFVALTSAILPNCPAANPQKSTLDQTIGISHGGDTVKIRVVANLMGQLSVFGPAKEKCGNIKYMGELTR